jgi:hypothetical protein
VANQQRFENTVAAKRREIVGVQQWRVRWMYFAIQRDDHTRPARHEQGA